MGEKIEPEKPGDLELALAAHAGDANARNALYLRYRSLIGKRIIPAKRLARTLAEQGSPIGPDDVEQESFLIFCRLLEEWNPETAPFAPFLAEKITYAAHDYVREAQHLRSSRVRWAPIKADPGLPLSVNSHWGAQHKEGEATVSPLIGKLYMLGPDAAEVVLSAEQWEALVSHLSEDWARLLRLRFWEDKSSKQIAQSEGCSQRTVDRTIKSALADLREIVQEEWDMP